MRPVDNCILFIKRNNLPRIDVLTALCVKIFLLRGNAIFSRELHMIMQALRLWRKKVTRG